MDVRAKQRLSFGVVLFPLACVLAVSPRVNSAVGRLMCAAHNEQIAFYQRIKIMPSILKLALLDKYKEYGVIFIRLIIGFHLVYGTQDNVFSYARMQEFAGFLSVRGVPVPLFSAFLSAYAQFICGTLFILGAATRYAAAVMIVNFIVALVIAHIGDTYPNTFPALMMLSAACFFLLHGAGKLSVDAALERRRKQA